MSSRKKLFSWALPFGDKCDPQCESDLHNAYCMIFPILGVIAVLSLVGFLRQILSFEFLIRHSLSYQEGMVCSLIVFAIFFMVTWKYQKKIIIFFWCRRCSQLAKTKKPEKRYGFPYIV